MRITRHSPSSSSASPDTTTSTTIYSPFSPSSSSTEAHSHISHPQPLGLRRDDRATSSNFKPTDQTPQSAQPLSSSCRRPRHRYLVVKMLTVRSREWSPPASLSSLTTAAAQCRHSRRSYLSRYRYRRHEIRIPQVRPSRFRTGKGYGDVLATLRPSHGSKMR